MQAITWKASGEQQEINPPAEAQLQRQNCESGAPSADVSSKNYKSKKFRSFSLSVIFSSFVLSRMISFIPRRGIKKKEWGAHFDIRIHLSEKRKEEDNIVSTRKFKINKQRQAKIKWNGRSYEGPVVNKTQLRLSTLLIDRGAAWSTAGVRRVMAINTSVSRQSWNYVVLATRHVSASAPQHRAGLLMPQKSRKTRH